MTPSQAIEKFPEMFRDLTALASHMRTEAELIAEEWDGLGRAGGQRDDHAAALLARLRPHLSALEKFASTCERQIDQFVADPFGTKGAQSDAT